MYKLVHSVAVAAVALVLPIAALADITNQNATLTSGQTFSLDTGAVVTSGGDIKWTGTSLTLVGSATGVDATSIEPALSGATGYSALSLSLITELAGNQLSSSALAPANNDVLVVKTNGGHYAKLLANSVGASISFEYTTYGASAGSGGGPNITGITNNYSNIPPGAPNYGISPGTLFVIYGSGFASAADVPKNTFPLAQSLNGTSVSVTVNGKTVTPGLYYVYPTQIAAVLPSTTPTGTGTVTVTNGSSKGAPFNITVVDSAFGIDTLYGTGTGQGVATDTNYKLIGYSNSAKPGQYMTFWGSGLGADTADDDLSYPLPHQDDLTSSLHVKAYVGGVPATVYYAGRSQFPGVDQAIVIVPQGVSFGCNVAVWFTSGASNRDSNFTSIPVSADGGPCSDPNSIFGGTDITALSGQKTIYLGFLAVFQDVSVQTGSPLAVPAKHQAKLPFSVRNRFPRATVQTQTFNDATGVFESIQGAELVNYSSYEQASIGSCVVWQYTYDNTTPPPPYTYTGLDAGTITVSGPSGTTPQTLMTIPTVTGIYEAQLPDNYITSAGGTYTFNSTGGKDVTGKINVSVNIGSPLFNWTEETTITSVTRSSGVTVHWSGGTPGTWVEIDGDSIGDQVYGGFYCLSPIEPDAFTVPAAVLSALPAGTGGMTLFNITKPVPFSAAPLNFAFAFGEVSSDSGDITYK